MSTLLDCRLVEEKYIGENFMEKGSKGPEDFLLNQSSATRRKVILTAASAASLSVMPLEVARAAPTPLSKTQINNFFLAVGAFNSMSSIPQNQSPLNDVLYSTVAVFKLNGGAWKNTPLARAAVIQLFYLLYNGSGPIYWPTFDPFYNGATPDFSNYPNVTGTGQNKGLWIDTDGSGQDLLNYKFVYTGDLISEIHAS
jgi:hypothetical protein